MDNLAIFSVQHNCVEQRDTSFEIPAKMPKCTGEKCICAWLWLANNVRLLVFRADFCDALLTSCTCAGYRQLLYDRL